MADRITSQTWAMLVFTLLVAPVSVASAGSVYRYIDADGVVHFSGAPVDVRYRRIRVKIQDGLAISPGSTSRGPVQSGYDRLIKTTAARYGVQPALVKAVIAAESNFEPAAVSHAGAQGLMQLMPATAAELGVSRPLGIIENMDGGVRYLRAMLDRYGDVSRALAAYNAGPGTVDRYGGIPPYPETEAYVERVLEYYRGYWSEFDRPAPPRGSPKRPAAQTSVAIRDASGRSTRGLSSTRAMPGPARAR